MQMYCSHTSRPCLPDGETLNYRTSFLPLVQVATTVVLIVGLIKSGDLEDWERINDFYRMFLLCTPQWHKIWQHITVLENSDCPNQYLVTSCPNCKVPEPCAQIRVLGSHVLHPSTSAVDFSLLYCSLPPVHTFTC